MTSNGPVPDALSLPVPAPEPEATPGAAPLRVLTVFATAYRLHRLQQVLRGLPVPPQVESVDTVVDALLRLTRRPAALLVLDMAVDDAFAPVVVRHLARVAPGTQVLVFDQQARSVPDHPPVHAWDALPTVLQHWWSDHGARLACAGASPLANDRPA